MCVIVSRAAHYSLELLFLLGTPPTTIVSVLPTVGQLSGCGDVVDFSKLNLGELQGLGSIFRLQM